MGWSIRLKSVGCGSAHSAAMGHKMGRPSISLIFESGFLVVDPLAQRWLEDEKNKIVIKANVNTLKYYY